MASVGLFDRSRLSIAIRRVGTCATPVRFSALVECTTTDQASQSSALTSCYWPPSDSQLFQDVDERHGAIEAKRRSALPIFLTPGASITLSGLRVFLNTEGLPLAAIAEGPVPTDHDRRGIYVPFEFPVPIVVPKNKPGVEWTQFATARADLRRSKSDIFEGRVAFGSDPPDLLLEGSSRCAVELAQFTHSERRQALALLQGVRDVVRTAAPDAIAHLAGHLVMIGFDTPRGLPPRKVDRGDITSVVAKLARLPVPVVSAGTGGNLRDGFVVSVTNNPLGQGNVAAFPIATAPSTELGDKCGFEIAASYTTTTTVNNTEVELARLVASHDREGNDILLLSAGAPGPSGLCLLADEIAVEPQLLEYMRLPSPRYLKRILLHRWTFGDVYELFPSLRCLATPLVSLTEGGVLVLPTRPVVDEAWTEACPCNSGQPFGACHGA